MKERVTALLTLGCIFSLFFYYKVYSTNVDNFSSINNIEGDIVKAKLVVESDNAWVKSMEFEIRELYTIPFDASSFAIPEDYERVEEPNRSWSNQNESK